MTDSSTPSADESRRDFLRTSVVLGGLGASIGTLTTAQLAQAQGMPPGVVPGTRNHYYIPATDTTVHWGYFSKSLKPLVEVNSGDFVTVETLTHHANDDAERMVKGDPGAESVFHWDRQRKGVDRRGAGPMQPTLFGRGAGEGLGVHVCTGPVAMRGAEPGDVLEVRIIDVRPRPCANPAYKGKSFGSNAAAWWGFHYKELLTEPKPREVITIYEVDSSASRTGRGPCTTTAGRRRPILPASCTRSSTIRACPSITAPCRSGTACSRTCGSRSALTSA